MEKIKLMQNELNLAINQLLGSLFDANAISDNVVYVLENAYAMPVASDLVHHRYAHIFPVIADTVNKIQILRCGRGTRTPVIGAEDLYPSVIDCFDALLKAALLVEKNFCNVIDICDDLDDKAVRIYIENAYLDILPLTKQAMLWFDKARKFDGNDAMFDSEFLTTLILDEHGKLA
jgi:hypothetical protein